MESLWCKKGVFIISLTNNLLFSPSWPLSFSSWRRWKKMDDYAEPFFCSLANNLSTKKETHFKAIRFVIIIIFVVFIFFLSSNLCCFFICLIYSFPKRSRWSKLEGKDLVLCFSCFYWLNWSNPSYSIVCIHFLVFTVDE